MQERDPDAMVVLVRDNKEVATWPLTWSGGPDLGLADVLARLQLVARHLGYSIVLRGASAELLGLLDLVGLADVVRNAANVALRQVVGEAEQREQAGVDEIVVTDDPVA